MSGNCLASASLIARAALNDAMAASPSPWADSTIPRPWWEMASWCRTRTSSGDRAVIAEFRSMAWRMTGSASAIWPRSWRTIPKSVRPLASIAAVLGPVGEVLGQPAGQRDLAAEVLLGVVQPAVLLLEPAQVVARGGQRLAMPGHGGELGDQLLRQLDRPAVIRLGRRRVTLVAVSQAAGGDGQCQLVAGLGELGVGGQGPLELGDGPSVGRLGLGKLAVEPEEVALALVGLAQAEHILGAGGRILLDVGQHALRLHGPAIQLICLALVGPAADQEVTQQRPGAGQRRLASRPTPAAPVSGSSIAIALR